MVNTQRKQQAIKPLAVLISDIHFSLSTLELAKTSLLRAIAKANKLDVQLIIAGDIHDSKANLRGECVKAIMDMIELAAVAPIVIVANHDRINERSKEHSLEFLRDKVELITEPIKIVPYGYILPYYHDAEELRNYLKALPKGSTLIMHQGIQGSNSGEYIQDKSAITKDDVAGFRVISGHYHQRQTISLPDGGKWDYIGSPYTMNFGEANDPEKGFQILYDDGSLEFMPTNLRKHVIVEMIEQKNKDWSIHTFDMDKIRSLAPEDLLLFKVYATKERLRKNLREDIAKLIKRDSFRLELIPTDTKIEIATKPKTQHELLDAIIDSGSSSDEAKTRLKRAWRDLCES